MHVRIVAGCIVCRQCECQAPDVFIVDEKAHTARVIEPAPAQAHEPDVIRAIKGCPVHVIKLKRDPKHVRELNARKESSSSSLSLANQPIGSQGSGQSALLCAAGA